MSIFCYFLIEVQQKQHFHSGDCKLQAESDFNKDYELFRYTSGDTVWKAHHWYKVGTDICL